MSLSRSILRMATRLVLLAIVLSAVCLPASAQNKKKSWEVFIYFGGFFGNEIPSATQSGSAMTYRTDPFLALGDPQQQFTDLAYVYIPNVGLVGGDQTSTGPNDPNYNYPNGPFSQDAQTQAGQPPCSGNYNLLSGPSDPRSRYFDECDGDQEAIWKYNATGIVTNGEVQRDDAEFMLGLRAGYNITSHWEVELDLGFGKQRVDLTQNLVPLLQVSTSDLNHPMADELARFYAHTWANADYRSVVPRSATPQAVNTEHPFIISSRIADDPNYNIPKYYPARPDDPSDVARDPEVFEDVTDFINRVLLDPQAWRNRANQINIDVFTLTALVTYNFNTKADSRVVPYLSGGFGRWMRSYSNPYQGDDTNYLTYGGGLRFFVNEIFSFRADFRAVSYLDDTTTITGSIDGVNVPDRLFDGYQTSCVRDNRDIRPPCNASVPNDPTWAFPDLGGGGGSAEIEANLELDDYFEFRIGFDVILGGK